MATEQGLPGGVVLASDEQLIERKDFSFSLVLFFLKTKVAVTNRRFVGEAPNTWLGLIPVGSKQITFPLGNIASAGTSTRVKMRRIILGLILVIIGLAGAQESPGALVLALLGLVLFLSAFETAIDITNNAGQHIVLPILLTQKGEAQSLISKVNQAIAEGS